jgi:hypothetical protein
MPTYAWKQKTPKNIIVIIIKKEKLKKERKEGWLQFPPSTPTEGGGGGGCRVEPLLYFFNFSFIVFFYLRAYVTQ